jgi:predicted enzyme related to lactoylglutathione lyase
MLEQNKNMEDWMAGYVVDYFELPATSNDASTRFFADAFGWTFKNYGPEYDEIHGAAVIGGINSDPEDRPPGPMIGIRAEDIAKAEQSVVAAGGAITRKTYDFPGGKRFHFREPGGSEMMVYILND